MVSKKDSSEQPQRRPEALVIPAGFEATDEVPDIEAYWDTASPDRNTKTGEGPGARYGHDPVVVTPLFVTLIDSGVSARGDEAPKSSTLVHCRLEAEAVLRSAERDAGDQLFPKGTIVGIWTKAGLKPLKKMFGAPVFIANGQQIRGQMHFFKSLGVAGRSPMVLFTIRPTANAEYRPMTVKNDYRDESLPEVQRARKERAAARREQELDAQPIDLDDIPF